MGSIVLTLKRETAGNALMSLVVLDCNGLIGGGLLVDLGGGTSTVVAAWRGADLGVRASSFAGIIGGEGEGPSP